MINRLVFLNLLLISMALVGCGATEATADKSTDILPIAQPLSPAEACPITQPPDPAFIPPQPYSPTAPYGNFWYGVNELWTFLQPDGRWQGLPHSNAGYGQKVFLWREGYNMQAEPEPQITMSGRRLDGDAPPFEQTGGTNGYHDDMGEFMLTGVTVPTAGCWEITARYGEGSLAFVVLVEP